MQKIPSGYLLFVALISRSIKRRLSVTTRTIKWVKYFLLLPTVLPIFTAFMGCECVSPQCQLGAYFTIIDKSTKQDLIFGSNPLYFVDSIFAKTLSDTTFLKLTPTSPDENSRFLILPYSDTIYLKLNSTEIDTILVSYKSSDKSYCCRNGFS